LSVAFSRDGRLLAAGGGSRGRGTIMVWESSSWTRLATLEAHADTVSSIEFSRDGMVLVSGSYDGSVKIWEIDSFAALSELRGPNTAVYCVAISPNGKIIASGGEQAVLWEVNTGEMIARIRLPDRVASIAFSPDGRTLAIAEDT